MKRFFTSSQLLIIFVIIFISMIPILVLAQREYHTFIPDPTVTPGPTVRMAANNFGTHVVRCVPNVSAIYSLLGNAGEVIYSTPILPPTAALGTINACTVAAVKDVVYVIGTTNLGYIFILRGGENIDNPSFGGTTPATISFDNSKSGIVFNVGSAGIVNLDIDAYAAAAPNHYSSSNNYVCVAWTELYNTVQPALQWIKWKDNGDGSGTFDGSSTYATYDGEYPAVTYSSDGFHIAYAQTASILQTPITIDEERFDKPTAPNQCIEPQPIGSRGVRIASTESRIYVFKTLLNPNVTGINNVYWTRTNGGSFLPLSLGVNFDGFFISNPLPVETGVDRFNGHGTDKLIYGVYSYQGYLAYFTADGSGTFTNYGPVYLGPSDLPETSHIATTTYNIGVNQMGEMLIGSPRGARIREDFNEDIDENTLATDTTWVSDGSSLFTGGTNGATIINSNILRQVDPAVNNLRIGNFALPCLACKNVLSIEGNSYLTVSDYAQLISESGRATGDRTDLSGTSDVLTKIQFNSSDPSIAGTIDVYGYAYNEGVAWGWVPGATIKIESDGLYELNKNTLTTGIGTGANADLRFAFMNVNNGGKIINNSAHRAVPQPIPAGFQPLGLKFGERAEMQFGNHITFGQTPSYDGTGDVTFFFDADLASRKDGIFGGNEDERYMFFDYDGRLFGSSYFQTAYSSMAPQVYEHPFVYIGGTTFGIIGGQARLDGAYFKDVDLSFRNAFSDGNNDKNIVQNSTFKQINEQTTPPSATASQGINACIVTYQEGVGEIDILNNQFISNVPSSKATSQGLHVISSSTPNLTGTDLITVKDNTISAPSGDGFNGGVLQFSTKSKICHNTVSACYGSGIKVLTNPSLITNNTVNNCSTNGIEADFSGNIVAGNNVTSCGNGGSFSSPNGTPLFSPVVDSNIFSTNSYGVWAHGDVAPQITGNVITNNTGYDLTMFEVPTQIDKAQQYCLDRDATAGTTNGLNNIYHNTSSNSNYYIDNSNTYTLYARKNYWNGISYVPANVDDSSPESGSVGAKANTCAYGFSIMLKKPENEITSTVSSRADYEEAISAMKNYDYRQTKMKLIDFVKKYGDRVTESRMALGLVWSANCWLDYSVTSMNSLAEWYKEQSMSDNYIYKSTALYYLTHSYMALGRCDEAMYTVDRMFTELPQEIYATGTYKLKKEIENICGGLDHSTGNGTITHQTNPVIELEQNSPNPFSLNTVITYSLSNDGPATLRVYNMYGQEVKTIVDGTLNKGIYSSSFSHEDLSNGIYFYTLRFGTNVVTKKMIIAR